MNVKISDGSWFIYKYGHWLWYVINMNLNTHGKLRIILFTLRLLKVWFKVARHTNIFFDGSIKTLFYWNMISPKNYQYRVFFFILYYFFVFLNRNRNTRFGCKHYISDQNIWIELMHHTIIYKTCQIRTNKYYNFFDINIFMKIEIRKCIYFLNLKIKSTYMY